MGADTEIQTVCYCCDRPVTIAPATVQGMRQPMVFCQSCFDQYDYVTLRQWYKVYAILHTLRNMSHGGQAA